MDESRAQHVNRSVCRSLSSFLVYLYHRAMNYVKKPQGRRRSCDGVKPRRLWPEGLAHAKILKNWPQSNGVLELEAWQRQRSLPFPKAPQPVIPKHGRGGVQQIRQTAVLRRKEDIHAYTRTSIRETDRLK